jgi:hypothetical protein
VVGIVTVGRGPVTAVELTDVGTTICALTVWRSNGREMRRESSILVALETEWVFKGGWRRMREAGMALYVSTLGPLWRARDFKFS